MKKARAAAAPAQTTVYDLAEKAGVSAMTVSRALSGNGYVAKATRARVLAAAEEMGYFPNIAAKGLKRTRTHVLGMLVNELHSPYLAQIVSAVSLATRRHRMDLFIGLTAHDPDDDSPPAIKHMLSGLCDGLLLALPRSRQLIETVERSGLPAVLLDYSRSGTTLDIVRGDNHDSAKAAVDHLLSLGHRRIAFIAGTSHTGQSPERQRGYLDSLKAAGLAGDPALIVQGGFDQAQAFERTRQLLALSVPPTAVFAASDEMAFGAMDAVRTLGLRVPDDVSIVGYDDIPPSMHTQPGLTTVRQSTTEIAEAAVRLLLQRIDDPAPAAAPVEFASQLVIRGSTGPSPSPG